ncbi:MAG: SMP-30/gluconolactonase/LRE family protein [Alphaproteobacteria bacterium]|nr:SMP-30/gluconolactonase/LRE family protein [Alphaproteobacteria bacterium]
MSDVTWIGAGMDRPECVAATAAGDIFVTRRDGLSRIGADGRTTHRVLGAAPDWMTNGFSIAHDGAFMLANLGNDGGAWRWTPTTGLQPFLREVDGLSLPTAVNFVGVDPQHRVWVSVSTRLFPRDLGFKRGIEDGFIVLVDGSGARIAADGIGFTNESHIDPSGRYLYVNETYARRTSRYPLRADGALGPKEIVTEYGDGAFPDGMAFDAEGHLWVACVVANRLIRVAPDGSQQVLLDDSDPQTREIAEAAFAADRFDRAILNLGEKRTLANLASLAFAGPDRKTLVLGSLAGTRLATFRSPIAGAKPHHWELRPAF